MPNPFTKDRNVIDAMGFNVFQTHLDFTPSPGHGIAKYRAHLSNKASLDALFVNQESDVLIVSCHGALPRNATALPRFERLRTFLNTPYSSIYFGDPTLHLSRQLGLAWYTGWKGLDIYPVIARWVSRAAEVSGADKILFVGSSGGGYASLQISALIPGSMAVPLNPQTAIAKYQPEGSLGYARNYVRNVMPHLAPAGGVKNISADVDWSAPLGSRGSALVRYSQPLHNYVYYAQNQNDTSHVTDHYMPFRRAVEKGPNKEKVRFHIYDGQHRHTSPTTDVFNRIITNALAWLEETKSPNYLRDREGSY